MPRTYAVVFKRSAERELRDIPRAELPRIVETIEALCINPRPPGCRKLKGHDAYRVRQGDYRVLYTIHDTERMIEIIKIGHRSEVYR
jgi:mRNA interferase RelE/StbE